MSSAQIWIAIFLGFIVLITIATRLRGGRSEHMSRRRLTELDNQHQQMDETLRGVRADLAEIHAQLSSLHRILEQVE